MERDMWRPASERRVNTSNGLKDCYHKAMARIWPCLSDVCHIRSTAIEQDSVSGGAGTTTSQKCAAVPRRTRI